MTQKTSGHQPEKTSARTTYEVAMEVIAAQTPPEIAKLIGLALDCSAVIVLTINADGRVNYSTNIGEGGKPADLWTMNAVFTNLLKLQELENQVATLRAQLGGLPVQEG